MVAVVLAAGISGARPAAGKAVSYDAIPGQTTALRSRESARQALNENRRPGPRARALFDIAQARDRDDEMFDAAARKGTIEAFFTYVKKRPNGRHVDKARNLAWGLTKKKGTRDAYNTYVKHVPTGPNADEARQHIAVIDAKGKAKQDDDAYGRAKRKGTIEALAEYGKKYPNGNHVDEARNLAWGLTKKKGTRDAYNTYVQYFPTGPNAGEARRHIAVIDAKGKATQDDDAYGRAKARGSIRAYGEYVRDWPAGRHVKGADDAAWSLAQRRKNKSAYQEYLSYFGRGRYRQAAKGQLAKIGSLRGARGAVGVPTVSKTIPVSTGPSGAPASGGGAIAVAGAVGALAGLGLVAAAAGGGGGIAPAGTGGAGDNDPGLGDRRRRRPIGNDPSIGGGGGDSQTGAGAGNENGDADSGGGTGAGAAKPEPARNLEFKDEDKTVALMAGKGDTALNPGAFNDDNWFKPRAGRSTPVEQMDVEGSGWSREGALDASGKTLRFGFGYGTGDKAGLPGLLLRGPNGRLTLDGDSKIEAFVKPGETARKGLHTVLEADGGIDGGGATNPRGNDGLREAGKNGNTDFFWRVTDKQGSDSKQTIQMLAEMRCFSGPVFVGGVRRVLEDRTATFDVSGDDAKDKNICVRAYANIDIGTEKNPVAGRGISVGDSANSPTAIDIEATGNISTTGERAEGIHAQSGNDAVRVSASGTITTKGQGARGIWAYSRTGAVRVSASGDISTTGVSAYGIHANSVGGAVRVSAGGDISTEGWFAYGISARSSAGAVSVSASGDISTRGVRAVGIYATSSEGGAVRVSASGDISTTGVSAYGIFAYSSKTTLVSIANTASVTSDKSVAVRTSLGKDIVDVAGTLRGGPAGGSGTAVALYRGDDMIVLRRLQGDQRGFAKITGKVDGGDGTDVIAFGYDGAQPTGGGELPTGLFDGDGKFQNASLTTGSGSGTSTTTFENFEGIGVMDGTWTRNGNIVVPPTGVLAFGFGFGTNNATDDLSGHGKLEVNGDVTFEKGSKLRFYVHPDIDEENGIKTGTYTVLTATKITSDPDIESFSVAYKLRPLAIWSGENKTIKVKVEADTANVTISRADLRPIASTLDDWLNGKDKQTAAPIAAKLGSIQSKGNLIKALESLGPDRSGAALSAAFSTLATAERTVEARLSCALDPVPPVSCPKVHSRGPLSFWQERGRTGVDVATPTTRFGAAFGNIASGGALFRGTFDLVGIGATVYAGMRLGPLSVTAQTHAARLSLSRTRIVALFRDTARTTTPALLYGVRVGARYDLDGGIVTLSPEVGLSLRGLNLPAHVEQGTDAALRFTGGTYTDAVASFGLAITKRFTHGDLSAYGAIERRLGGSIHDVSAGFKAGGRTFTVPVARPAATQVRFSLHGMRRVGNMSAALSYDIVRDVDHHAGINQTLIGRVAFNF